MDSVLSPPAATELPAPLRAGPPPRRGGPVVLLRWLHAHRMLTWRYALLALRLGWLKLRYRGRLRTDGMAFVGPGVRFEIGREATVELGRWSWIGHGSRIRAHEGRVTIGAKAVLGQECTLSAYQHISIGRESILADRVMLIDFDHHFDDVERPIRLQGIRKADVRLGNNVWVGHGAAFLRGVSVGDNVVVGTYAVVNRDVPDNAVVGGVPARLLRLRDAPRTLRWR